MDEKQKNEMTTIYSSIDSKSYPPNKKETKDKKVEKIITGEIVRRKKSPVASFFENFFMSDMSDLASYAVNDVLIPSIKDAIADVIHGSIDMLLYNGRKSSSNSRNNGYTYYDKVSYGSNRNSRKLEDEDRRKNKVRSPNDIFFNNISDANSVLINMKKYIESYDYVTVSDFYDFVGVSCDFIDNKWGWSDLSRAYVQRARGNRGYQIILPDPEPID